MRHDAVLGGDAYEMSTASPGKVASHMIAKARRRGRVRSCFLLTIITITAVSVFLSARRHSVADIQPPDPPPIVHVKTHIPSRISRVPVPTRDVEDFSGGDDVGSKNEKFILPKRPRFHLLVPAQKPTPNLCRTLLSAATLNYPSPVLINYGSNDSDRQTAANIIHKTYDFLSGPEAKLDDLILIVDEDSWFQLPAEITVNRFIYGMTDSDAKLLEKYGRKPPKINLNSWRIPLGSPRYNQRVIFSAQKECSSSVDDLACYSAPQSPLVTGIDDPQPDGNLGSKYTPARYLSPTMAIGHVADLLPIYNRANDMLKTDHKGLYSNQNILSHIYGKQEYVRSVRSAPHSISQQASSWTGFQLGLADDPVPQHKIAPKDFGIQLGKNYEFGIGLDYIGSIFQVLSNSTQEMKFISFKQPPRIIWPSPHPRSGLENLIQLPLDLSHTRPPFARPLTPSLDPNPPFISALDDMPPENITWEDINLITNTINPSGSVASVLNFQGNQSLQDNWWHNMWYQQHGRALLRQHIRDSRKGISTKMTAGDDEQWWFFRDGKGGVWTDDGTWLHWNEVCGDFEEEVFGDGKGTFGAELWGSTKGEEEDH